MHPFSPIATPVAIRTCLTHTPTLNSAVYSPHHFSSMGIHPSISSLSLLPSISIISCWKVRHLFISSTPHLSTNHVLSVQPSSRTVHPGVAVGSSHQRQSLEVHRKESLRLELSQEAETPYIRRSHILNFCLHNQFLLAAEMYHSLLLSTIGLARLSWGLWLGLRVSLFGFLGRRSHPRPLLLIESSCLGLELGTPLPPWPPSIWNLSGLLQGPTFFSFLPLQPRPISFFKPNFCPSPTHSSWRNSLLFFVFLFFQ